MERYQNSKEERKMCDEQNLTIDFPNIHFQGREGMREVHMLNAER